jgi:hypothetical protein
VPALIRSAIALPLDNIHLVAHATALHVQAFPAVDVHQLKIAVGSACAPSLIPASVPGVLLHVSAILPAVSVHVQNHTAIHVSDGELPAAQRNKLPALISAAIASVLLNIRTRFVLSPYTSTHLPELTLRINPPYCERP